MTVSPTAGFASVAFSQYVAFSGSLQALSRSVRCSIVIAQTRPKTNKLRSDLIRFGSHVLGPVEEMACRWIRQVASSLWCSDRSKRPESLPVIP